MFVLGIKKANINVCNGCFGMIYLVLLCDSRTNITVAIRMQILRALGGIDKRKLVSRHGSFLPAKAKK